MNRRIRALKRSSPIVDMKSDFTKRGEEFARSAPAAVTDVKRRRCKSVVTLGNARGHTLGSFSVFDMVSGLVSCSDHIVSSSLDPSFLRLVNRHRIPLLCYKCGVQTGSGTWHGSLSWRGFQNAVLTG